MCPRRPTTVTSSAPDRNVNTGTRWGYVRFVSPPDRIVAIRAAVLFFSVTMSFRIGWTRTHGRALFNRLAVILGPTRAHAHARETTRFRRQRARDFIGRGKLVSSPRRDPE